VRAQAEQRAQAKSEWYDEQLHHLELQRQENARLKEQNIKAKWVLLAGAHASQHGNATLAPKPVWLQRPSALP
jgi:hypothetical protein